MGTVSQTLTAQLLKSPHKLFKMSSIGAPLAPPGKMPSDKTAFFVEELGSNAGLSEGEGGGVASEFSRI